MAGPLRRWHFWVVMGAFVAGLLSAHASWAATAAVPAGATAATNTAAANATTTAANTAKVSKGSFLTSPFGVGFGVGVTAVTQGPNANPGDMMGMLKGIGGAAGGAWLGGKLGSMIAGPAARMLPGPLGVFAGALIPMVVAGAGSVAGAGLLTGKLDSIDKGKAVWNVVTTSALMAGMAAAGAPTLLGLAGMIGWSLFSDRVYDSLFGASNPQGDGTQASAAPGRPAAPGERPDLTGARAASGRRNGSDDPAEGFGDLPGRGANGVNVGAASRPGARGSGSGSTGSGRGNDVPTPPHGPGASSGSGTQTAGAGTDSGNPYGAVPGVETPGARLPGGPAGGIPTGDIVAGPDGRATVQSPTQRAGNGIQADAQAFGNPGAATAGTAAGTAGATAQMNPQMMAQLLSQLADSLASFQQTQTAISQGAPAYAGGPEMHPAGKIPVPGVPEWSSYFQH